MMDDKSLLVCPQCKGALDKIAQGLSCGGCSKEFSITNGVPRFVLDDKYVGNFSFEWKIHRSTQIDDGEFTDSAEFFNLRFGKDKEFWTDKKVLDVGVGVGRYAKVALDMGAKVVGVDLSYSIDVAGENLSGYENYEGVQADLFELPFADESFDVIYSFGVLHHTPDPRIAFEGLLRLLKPGGTICITVYEDRGMYHSSRYLRKLTTKLPPAILYPLCVVYTSIMYVPYRYLGFRYGFFGRFAPISLSSSFKEAILDTFDCYSPQYQFTYSDYDIFRWYKENKLNDIEIRPQPVTVSGKR